MKVFNLTLASDTYHCGRYNGNQDTRDARKVWQIPHPLGNILRDMGTGYASYLISQSPQTVVTNFQRGPLQ